MSYTAIAPHFAIGQKNLRSLPGLYGYRRGMRGMGQEPDFAVADAFLQGAPPAAAANACTDPSTVNAACVAYLKQLAAANGVDPNYIDQGVASGLDSLQLMFIADGTSPPEQELATAETVNTDFPPDETGTGAGLPPSSSWCSEDSLGLGLNNCWYIGIGALGLLLVGGIFGHKL